MSKDLITSASINATEAILNTIILNNDDIGNSIQPKLVKRASLSPVIGENGELESRVYYTLHNDAGLNIYISPHLVLEEESRVSTVSIPHSNTEFFTQFIPAIPPRKPYKTLIHIKDADTLPDENFTGGFSVSGGTTSGSTNNKDDSGVVVEELEKENFDDYSFILTGIKDSDGRRFRKPSRIKTLEDIIGFYQNTSNMISANRAMKYTRNELKSNGTNIILNLNKLQEAEEMYLGSKIIKCSGQYKQLRNASKMFKDCPFLQKVVLSNLENLANTSYMFQNCTKLQEAYLLSNEGGISNDASYMFDGCTSLKIGKAIVKNAHNTSYMFRNCQALRNININLVNVDSAKGMFYKCSNLREVEGSYGVINDAEDLFIFCENLKTLPTFDRLINCKWTFYKCKSLKKLNYSLLIPNKPVLYDNCDNAFRSCDILEDVPSCLTQVTSARSMFQDCQNLKMANLDIPKCNNASGMYLGCPINSIQDSINFSNLIQASVMLKNARLSLDDATRIYMALPEPPPAPSNEKNRSCIDIGVSSGEKEETIRSLEEAGFILMREAETSAEFYGLKYKHNEADNRYWLVKIHLN